MIRKSITLLAFLSITVLVISGLKSLADTADGEDITALSDAVPTEYVEVPKDLSAIELIADEIPDVTDDAIEKELDVYRGYTKVTQLRLETLSISIISERSRGMLSKAVRLPAVILRSVPNNLWRDLRKA